jgi:Flp pilus assembly protein TadG
MNRKNNYQPARTERGANLVEAALALLLTLTILFGIMEFGRAVWSYNTVAHAAREGARFAMVHGKASKSPATQATVQAVVRRQAIGLLPANTQVVVTWIPDNAPGSAVKVAVTYNFSSIVPFVSSSVMSLKGTSQMVILN